MKKTAVIMAVYNGQNYLEEQLESIARQSHPVDQLILRDDGSTDQSERIIHKFIQDHPQMDVVYLKSDQNQGYKENFHQLLKAVDAEWIFLCDQDDRWHEDKAAQMLQIAEENDQIELLCSSFTFMDSDSQTYQVEPRPGWSNNNLYPMPVEANALVSVDFEQLIFHNFFQGCAMMLSKKLKDQILSCWDERIPHDWLAALCASWNKGLYFYNRSLFDYRIHSNNTTGMVQGQKLSFMEKLANINSYYFRTIVKKDSLNVLQVIHDRLPQAWNENRQREMDFFKASLKAIDEGSLTQMWKLKNDPLYPANSGPTGWLADFLFIALHPRGFQKGK